MRHRLTANGNHPNSTSMLTSLFRMSESSLSAVQMETLRVSEGSIESLRDHFAPRDMGSFAAAEDVAGRLGRSCEPLNAAVKTQ